MKTPATTILATLLVIAGACSSQGEGDKENTTDDGKQGKEEFSGSADESVLPEQTLPAPAEETTPAEESSESQFYEVPDSEAANQEDYSAVDPYGSAYDPSSPVPYDQRYGDAAATSPDQIQQYGQALNRPYQQYANEYQRPYLNDRYAQHRSFLNHDQRLNDGRRGGGWEQGRYQQTRRNLDRSRRWVNYDLYNIIMRTLTALNGRGYRSQHGYDEQVRGAIRRRDHRSAVQYHDLLLQEALR